MSINQIFHYERRGGFNTCIPLHLPFMDGSLQSHGFRVAISIDTQGVEVIVVDDLTVHNF